MLYMIRYMRGENGVECLDKEWRFCVSEEDKIASVKGENGEDI
jgi:hypothetical protein